MNENSNIAFRPHDHSECQQHSLDAIEKMCESRKLRLTARRRQVLEVLMSSHQPMGAYQILDELNQAEPGTRIAPPIVYRALEFLLDLGIIHRIESLNAYIFCSQPGHQCVSQFLICRHCERVAELETTNQNLIDAAENLGFEVDYSVVEITGVCAECREHA